MNVTAITPLSKGAASVMAEAAPPADALSTQPPSADLAAAGAAKMAPIQIVLIAFGTMAFLYLARPVVLPIFLACVAGMALKPLIRWLSDCHIPPALSSGVVLCLLVSAVVLGCLQLGRPALMWVDETPQKLTELRQRIQRILPPGARFSAAAAALNNLGATEAEQKEDQKRAPTVQVKDNHSSASLMNWTQKLLIGAGETLVLLYLLLASGDLFLQKLVRVIPTLRDKKRAVDICHEVQQNISNYLFSVSMINLGLGLCVCAGIYFMGVPNAAMWGVLVAVLNFVPYFGPVAGVLVLAAVGLLTFDTLGKGLLPPAWYLVLHLLEANLITPILLGRRFTLNPVVIFISLIFWTWLWGVPGALLSVPVLVSIKVVCDRLPSMSHLSELLSRQGGRILPAVPE